MDKIREIFKCNVRVDVLLFVILIIFVSLFYIAHTYEKEFEKIRKEMKLILTPDVDLIEKVDTNTDAIDAIGKKLEEFTNKQVKLEGKFDGKLEGKNEKVSEKN